MANVTKQLNLKFYLNLINLNQNLVAMRVSWMLDAVVDSLALEDSGNVVALGNSP